MKLSEAKGKFIFTTRIELESLGDGEFIELREPNQKEIVNLSDDATKNLEMMGKIFPACVVASSFVDDEGKASTGEAIYTELQKSASLCTEVLSTWLNSIPFQHRLMNSAKSGK